jgi:hypothetical protein
MLLPSLDRRINGTFDWMPAVQAQFDVACLYVMLLL